MSRCIHGTDTYIDRCGFCDVAASVQNASVGFPSSSRRIMEAALANRLSSMMGDGFLPFSEIWRYCKDRAADIDRLEDKDRRKALGLDPPDLSSP